MYASCSLVLRPALEDLEAESSNISSEVAVDSSSTGWFCAMRGKTSERVMTRYGEWGDQTLTDNTVLIFIYKTIIYPTTCQRRQTVGSELSGTPFHVFSFCIAYSLGGSLQEPRRVVFL